MPQANQPPNLDQDEEAGWEPDFHWLTEELAVGGCFPIERAGELASEHGIGAVVDLRQEDRDDDRRLRTAGIEFLHLPTPDLQPASAEMLEEGVRFAREHRMLTSVRSGGHHVIRWVQVRR